MLKFKFFTIVFLITQSVVCYHNNGKSGSSGFSIEGVSTINFMISQDISSVTRALDAIGLSITRVTIDVANDERDYHQDLSFNEEAKLVHGTVEGLIVGTYTVTLKAYGILDESETVLAEGSCKDVKIIPGETTEVSIAMNLLYSTGLLDVIGWIAIESPAAPAATLIPNDPENPKSFDVYYTFSRDQLNKINNYTSDLGNAWLYISLQIKDKDNVAISDQFIVELTYSPETGDIEVYPAIKYLGSTTLTAYQYDCYATSRYMYDDETVDFMEVNYNGLFNIENPQVHVVSMK